MFSKLLLPISIPSFFALTVGSYVHYSLQKEHLTVVGKSIGYRLINDEPHRSKEIFRKVYAQNEEQIKQVYPEIKNADQLQGWCKISINNNWNSYNGSIIMNGLKWCSIPTYIALGRDNNKLDEETFNNYFNGRVSDVIRPNVNKFFPNLGAKGKTEAEVAKVLKGEVIGFCDRVLNDAWSGYYENNKEDINALCPDGPFPPR